MMQLWQSADKQIANLNLVRITIVKESNPKPLRYENKSFGNIGSLCKREACWISKRSGTRALRSRLNDNQIYRVKKHTRITWLVEKYSFKATGYNAE